MQITDPPNIGQNKRLSMNAGIGIVNHHFSRPFRSGQYEQRDWLSLSGHCPQGRNKSTVCIDRVVNSFFLYLLKRDRSGSSLDIDQMTTVMNMYCSQ